MRLKEHLNKIVYFSIVAETGSLKKASKKALVSQPQLTKVIQQLEDILDSKLFVRSAKGVTLTKSGQQLYSYSSQILEKTDEAEFSIKSKESKNQTSVRIGACNGLAQYVFPDLSRYLTVTAPNMKISLKTAPSTDLISQLEDNIIDLAVVVSPKVIPLSIHIRKIYSDSIGFYRSPNLSADSLNKLITCKSPVDYLEGVAEEDDFQEGVVCDNLETVKSLTEQSVGVGLLPHKFARSGVLLKALTAFTHPQYKLRTLNSHDVILAHQKKQPYQERNLLFNEVEKFLHIWSS